MAEHGLRKVIITITVIAAAVIELIDTSIVNVALSQMSGNLGATLEDVAWVVTAYAIANVIIIPMTSFLAAKLGRRRYYIGSILLFTGASLLCGNATNLWELVTFRFLQGLGGGALLSTSQAILFETFTVKERPIASALFGVGVFVGPTIGPTAGGWIIDHSSWPWIFYINLPIGLGAALLSYFYIKEPERNRPAPAVDWLGIGLLVIGLGALQTVLERGETADWFSAGYIVVLSVVAALGLAAFVGWELHTKTPVVDLRVLRSRSLAVAAVLTFVLGFALFASVFIVPVFAQRLLGFTATQTGVLFLPGAAVSIVALPLVGKFLSKGVPPHYFVVAGFLGTALFTYSLSLSTLSTGADDFFWPIILRAVSLGLMIVPLTQLAVSGLATPDIGQGVALNNMMRQLGGSFGIALINTYIVHRAALHRVDLVSHLSAGDPATETRLRQLTAAMQAKGATLFEAKQRALGLLEATVAQQSSLLSYMDAFKIIAIFSLFCIPLMLLAGRPKPVGTRAAASAAEAH